MKSRLGLGSVHRGVAEDDWGYSLYERAQKMPHILGLYAPEEWHVPLFLARELSRVSFSGLRAAEFREELLEAMPSSFAQEQTVTLLGLKAVGKNRDSLVAVLEPNKQLEKERELAARFIKRSFVTNFMPNFYMNIVFGKVDSHNNDLVIDRLKRQIPKTVDLLPGETKLRII